MSADAWVNGIGLALMAAIVVWFRLWPRGENAMKAWIGLVLLLAGLAAGYGLLRPAAVPVPVAVEAGEGAAVSVYKTPSCGCCNDWIGHLQQAGFAVTAHDVADVSPLKIEAGITPALASCHTALVDGYVIEGHVPAADIRRLLAERPDAVGLTVPGMPMGSPGMEGAWRDAYDVLLIRRDGRTEVFNHYAP